MAVGWAAPLRHLVMLGVALAMAPSAFAADKAANFTLRDIDNQQVSLDDYAGKVRLLSFWATWCGPCKVEMAHLHELYQALKDDGFVVLSISSDDARTAPQVKPYIKRKQYTFPVLLDKQSDVTKTFNPSKQLPYGVLIDRDGNIVKVYSGYNPGDEVQVEADIRSTLTSAVPAPAAPAPDAG